jgi:NADH dehydrogenase (ubiquinone) 1 alpha subcomplex subunit 5
MAAYTKAFTGLTGLAVSKNPVHTLGVLYSKNLRALAKMPLEYPYRKNTESLINERAAIIKKSSTIEEAEKKIGMGQIEEVIIQAENELVLSRSILEWKAWEPLCEAAPANQWKWPI